MSKHHATGYMVWTYGICRWHRSLDRAIERARNERGWCSEVQVVECATGRRVY